MCNWLVNLLTRGYCNQCKERFRRRFRAYFGLFCPCRIITFLLRLIISILVVTYLVVLTDEYIQRAQQSRKQDSNPLVDDLMQLVNQMRLYFKELYNDFITRKLPRATSNWMLF